MNSSLLSEPEPRPSTYRSLAGEGTMPTPSTFPIPGSFLAGRSEPSTSPAITSTRYECAAEGGDRARWRAALGVGRGVRGGVPERGGYRQLHVVRSGYESRSSLRRSAVVLRVVEQVVALAIERSHTLDRI